MNTLLGWRPRSGRPAMRLVTVGLLLLLGTAADAGQTGTIPNFRSLDAGPNAAELEVTEGPSGAPAVRITCREYVAGSVCFRWQVEQPIRRGVMYRLLALCRHEGIRGAQVAVRVMGGEPLQELGAGVLRPDLSWHRKSIEFWAAADAAQPVIELSFASGGTLLVADPRIDELPHRLAPLPYPCRHANRIYNSSFELGAAGWGTLEAESFIGEVVPSGRHGRHCLLISLREPELTRLRFNWPEPRHEVLRRVSAVTLDLLALDKGQPMTLSALLRSHPPGARAILGLVPEGGQLQAAEVTVDGGWARYSAVFTPDTDRGRAFVGLDLGTSELREASLWIDAVQLEVGESPSHYTAAHPVEVSTEVVSGGGLFDVGRPLELRLRLLYAAPKPAPVAVAVQVYDAFGRRVFADSFARQLSDRQQVEVPVRVDLPHPGVYTVATLLRGNDCLSERRLRVYRAPRPSKLGQMPKLGLDCPPPTDAMTQPLRHLGVTWVRDRSLAWSLVSPEAGRYDFSEADEQLTFQAAQGWHTVATLSWPAAVWASVGPRQRNGEPTPDREPSLHRWSPRSLEKFDEYLQQVTQFAAGRVAAWQFLDRPADNPPADCFTLADLDCLTLLAQRQIRAKRPDALAVFLPPQALQGTCASRVADILVVYPKMGHDPAAVKHDLNCLAALRHRPVWAEGVEARSSRLAQSERDVYAQGQELEGAAALVRSLLPLLSSRVSAVFFASDAAVSTPVAASVANPFFGYGGEPRPAAVALAALFHLLGDTGAPEMVKADDQLCVYRWRRAHETVFCVWAWTPMSPPQLRNPQNAVRFLDLFGAPTLPPEELGRLPVYVVCSS